MTHGQTSYDAIGSEVFVTYRGRRSRYCVMPTVEDAVLFANAKNRAIG